MRKAPLPIAAVAVSLLAFAPTTMARESAAPTLTVKSSSFGRVVFDSRGFVLYAFTRDKNEIGRAHV